MLPQWHRMSTIFRASAYTMGWLRVSLKHPYTNFRKTVCPKKSLDAVLILQKTVWVFSHKYPSRHLPTQSEQ